METIYRQKRFGLLTPEHQQLKLQKDAEYELAVQNLSTDFYQKKRTAGVTPQEEGDYAQAKTILWNDYLEWAKTNSLYEEVTPEQQLAEAETVLDEQLEVVNQMRTELNRKLLEIKEASVRIV